jgi:hypothetical protein
MSRYSSRRRRGPGGHGAHDGKEGPARDDARREVAYIAARLIAEEGMTDYGQAKQKAARQAGLLDAKALPDNGEIEAALREYQALYQGEEHEALLTDLREHALKLMQRLAEFNPRLTGTVLDGTATAFSAIELDLFTDSGKDVELHLINRNIAYKAGEKSRAHGGAGRDSLVVLDCHFADIPVTLNIHPVNDLRVVEKRAAGGAQGRADMAAVAALLAQAAPHDE